MLHSSIPFLVRSSRATASASLFAVARGLDQSRRSPAQRTPRAALSEGRGSDARSPQISDQGYQGGLAADAPAGGNIWWQYLGPARGWAPIGAVGASVQLQAPPVWPGAQAAMPPPAPHPALPPLPFFATPAAAPASSSSRGDEPGSGTAAREAEELQARKLVVQQAEHVRRLRLWQLLVLFIVLAEAFDYVAASQGPGWVAADMAAERRAAKSKSGKKGPPPSGGAGGGGGSGGEVKDVAIASGDEVPPKRD